MTDDDNSGRKVTLYGYQRTVLEISSKIKTMNPFKNQTNAHLHDLQPPYSPDVALYLDLNSSSSEKKRVKLTKTKYRFLLKKKRTNYIFGCTEAFITQVNFL